MVLISGGGYLPIDTSYPEHLLVSVLEDSQPTVVITCPDLVSRLQSFPCEIITGLVFFFFLERIIQVQSFLYRAFILEQSPLDEMKGI